MTVLHFTIDKQTGIYGCNHPGRAKKTNDLEKVTCATCRELILRSLARRSSALHSESIMIDELHLKLKVKYGDYPSLRRPQLS